MNERMGDEPETDRRDRIYMAVAFSLIVAPFMMFIIFLLIRSVQPGSAQEWAFVVAMIWFLASDSLLERLAGRVEPIAALGRFDTPKTRNRLIKAVALAPTFAFCFVDEEARGAAAVHDWLCGFALLLALYPIVDMITEAIGKKWGVWRKSRT